MFANLIPYEGREYVCAPAGRDDAGAVEDILCRTSMQGWVRVAFPPGPEAASDPFCRERLLVCVRMKDAGRACVAVYAIQRLGVHLEGRAESCVYLSLLRVPPAYRGRGGIFRDGFAAIPHFVRQLGWPERYVTSIATDNLPARRLLEAGLRQLPRYAPQGELRTLLFARALGRERGLLEKADAELFPEIVRFHNRMKRDILYSPVLGEEFLRKGTGLAPGDFYVVRRQGEIKGCLALWDRRHARRILIEGYRPLLNVLRPVCNLWAGLRGKPCLPAPGRELEAAHIAFLTLDHSVAPLAGEILRDALFHAGRTYGVEAAMLGLAAGSPLYSSLTALPHVEYSTLIESVDWKDGNAVHAARAPVQPEIALL